MKSFFVLFIISIFDAYSNNLTVIGPADFNDGLGRISIGIIDHLKKDLNINFISSRNVFYERCLSKDTLSIIKKRKNILGDIIIFTDSLNNNQILKALNINRNDSKQIKLAYSMFESSRIPKSWVKEINDYFDAVIVPDDYLVNVYLNSGIEKPIFVLPLGLYLDEFLCYKNIKKHKQFIFGCLSNFDLRKNQMLLIKAFIQEFGNNKNIVLKINGRSFDYTNLNKYIKELKFQNIILSKANLSWKQYIEFMSTLDCYVNISKGEGFSVPPREALAMKIPCLLTNNTAQSTICNTGFVKSIRCDILEQAKFYINTYDKHEDLGLFFNCELNEVKKALRDIYENHNEYQKKAKLGKKWVKQYKWQNLKNKYLSLFRPKKLIFAKYNEITDSYLMTNSITLYNKYLSYLNKL